MCLDSEHIFLGWNRVKLGKINEEYRESVAELVIYYFSEFLVVTLQVNR